VPRLTCRFGPGDRVWRTHGAGHGPEHAGSVISVAFPGFGRPRYEVTWVVGDGQTGVGRHWEHELTDVMPGDDDDETPGFGGVTICGSDRPEIMGNYEDD
jgi:hypothetical protein